VTDKRTNNEETNNTHIGIEQCPAGHWKKGNTVFLAEDNI